MKRFLTLLGVYALTIATHAQQFGLSAQGLAFFQVPRQYEFGTGQDERIIRTNSMPSAGFRIECNYILPGYSVPVSAYNGVGITYVAPKEDSCVYYARLDNGGGLAIAGTRKTSMLSIGFRCGYEIPQEFNDFLLLHVGWGMSWIRYSNRYILPDQSADFPFEASDFEGTTFDKTNSRAIGLELTAGAVYEFEYFSALAQYSFIFPAAASDENVVSMRHGISVGIFYPLYRF